jgi:hypothetical protein
LRFVLVHFGHHISAVCRCCPKSFSGGHPGMVNAELR